MRKIPKVISHNEFEMIMKATKKKKNRCAYALGYYQCMRVSEVINLRKENIDTEAGFIHIKQAKGCKDRDIPIMKPAIFYFRFLPIGVSRQAIHKAIKKIGKKVLDKDINFHTLRHSGASTYLNDKGVDIRNIQKLLGHSRLSTTQIYTHVNPAQLKNAFKDVW
jgi:site-specific recombinase XerD